MNAHTDIPTMSLKDKMRRKTVLQFVMEATSQRDYIAMGDPERTIRQWFFMHVNTYCSRPEAVEDALAFIAGYVGDLSRTKGSFDTDRLMDRLGRAGKAAAAEVTELDRKPVPTFAHYA